jgi:hypothetical protein
VFLANLRIYYSHEIVNILMEGFYHFSLLSSRKYGGGSRSPLALPSPKMLEVLDDFQNFMMVTVRKVIEKKVRRRSRHE